MIIRKVTRFEIRSPPSDGQSVHLQIAFSPDNLIQVIPIDVFRIVEFQMRDSVHLPITVDRIVDSRVFEHERIKPPRIAEFHSYCPLFCSLVFHFLSSECAIGHIMST